MTEFTQTLRHYCRNPRCRSKLPSPASDPRKAFCTRGCHSSFYRKRCVVCESGMVRKTGNQLVCGKRRCRNALQANASLGRYLPSLSIKLTQERPGFIGSKGPPKADRAWHIVAGPELPPSQLHCAAVADGVDGVPTWRGGDYERLEAKHRAALKAHFAKAHFAERAKECLIQPHHLPVNILGGYNFPDVPSISPSLESG